MARHRRAAAGLRLLGDGLQRRQRIGPEPSGAHVGCNALQEELCPVRILVEVAAERQAAHATAEDGGEQLEKAGRITTELRCRHHAAQGR